MVNELGGAIIFGVSIQFNDIWDCCDVISLYRLLLCLETIAKREMLATIMVTSDGTATTRNATVMAVLCLSSLCLLTQEKVEGW